MECTFKVIYRCFGGSLYWEGVFFHSPKRFLYRIFVKDKLLPIFPLTVSMVACPVRAATCYIYEKDFKNRRVNDAAVEILQKYKRESRGCSSDEDLEFFFFTNA